jgi:hypothetical protein
MVNAGQFLPRGVVGHPPLNISTLILLGIFPPGLWHGRRMA